MDFTSAGSVQELMDVALEAAGTAAGVLRQFAGSTLREVTTKSSPTDLVSEADRASEASIAATLKRRRPLDSLRAEEGTGVLGSSGVEWVADPLDGTTNFFFQVPAYCVSLAARCQGEPLAGVVVDCARDETWAAGAGQGAWLNGSPCQVAQGRSLPGTALVATGFSYQSAVRTRQAEVVARLIGQVRDIRRLGSAALDLCWVAGGRYDAYYEAGLNDWDWAAGELICKEAGASVGTLGCGALLATTPSLWGALSQAIDQAHTSAGATVHWQR